jgi:hypothetical protein
MAEDAKGPLPRHRAALICSMIAYVDIMAPKAHVVAKLKKMPSLDHKVQRENARLLLDSYYHFNEEEEEERSGTRGGVGQSHREAFLQLEAETLYCAYSCTAGLMRRGWQGIGRAIRLGNSLAIFVEGPFGSEEWENELKRNIAWELIILDR